MRDQGIISPALQDEELQFETTLRPQRLAEFTGQSKLKEVLSISIEAARRREEREAGIMEDLRAGGLTIDLLGFRESLESKLGHKI